MLFKTIRHEQNHMATTFDLRISCPESLSGLADRTLSHAHHEISQLENELTEFRELSPVYQLNHSPVEKRIQFTPSAMELLLKSFEMKHQTQGAFNPLAKSQGENPALAWDTQTLEVWKLTSGTWLGFGAIGKGFALDRARESIEAVGFDNYLLSGGGSSIAISGYESPNRPWKWGWSWKKNESGENMGLHLVHDNGKRIALGVSGTHEKGNHIIKSSQAPVSSTKGARSALIATHSACEADALSTALFVSGWDELKSKFTDAALPPAAAWIDDEEVPHWNGAFNHLWKTSLSSLLTVFLAITTFFLTTQKAFSDESVEINLDDVKSFTPYIFERSAVWVLLPVLMFIYVVLHLKKTKPKVETKGSLMNFTQNAKPNPNTPPPFKGDIKSISTLLIATSLYLSVENATAAPIEPLNHAVGALLKTTKAFKKTVNDGTGDVPVFYSKDASGKSQRVVFIEKGIYPPDCTHTWAIAFDAKSKKLVDIHAIEFGCPHANPTNSPSFMDQYKGKSPADAAKLDAAVTIVAKATGTCNLLTAAVKRTFKAMASYKD